MNIWLRKSGAGAKMPESVRALNSIEQTNVDQLRGMVANLRRYVNSFKASRERAHAITKLQEFEYWAEQAINQ